MQQHGFTPSPYKLCQSNFFARSAVFTDRLFRCIDICQTSAKCFSHYCMRFGDSFVWFEEQKQCPLNHEN